MKYREMTENDLQYVVGKNIEYYNTVEDCCWTYEKAYKRIHQVLTMEDSMCLVQMDQNDNITGYLMGYFKEYDDKHKKFYSGLGFYPVNNFVMMGKFMD
ncbi:hypothetical protein [Butyrivibrio sp. MC2021]|uniref:hypothetical protein n=1 Tax=Butyrivibrio sp. MC2021 TaxID=1408306 RepID=UPI0006876452|nr:hypothetical protein [Butyrivibrio sp. MC2021]